MRFLENLLSRIPETGVPVHRVVMGPFWTLVETAAGAIRSRCPERGI